MTKNSIVRLRTFVTSSFVIGLASLLWLIIRTGTKPSRAAYPCQRMAAANASAWLGAAVVPLVIGRVRHIREVLADRPWRHLLLALAVVIAVGSARSLGERTMALPATSQSVRLELQSQLAGPTDFSDIAAVNGTTGADDGVARLIRMLNGGDGGGFYRRAASVGEGGESSGIVGPDDVVLIKINSQWDKRGGTNTDLLRSLILAIAEHPDGFTGEVIVADNGQAQYGSQGGGGSMEWESNNAIDRSQSVRKVVDELDDQLRVSAVLWDEFTQTEVDEFRDGDYSDGFVLSDEPSPFSGIIVSYPKFTTQYGTMVSFKLGVWERLARSYDHDALVVINVPVLKTHMIYGVTAAVKHYMGVVSDKLTGHNAHRSVGTGGMGTQMAQTRVPNLNILDAIWINARPGNGPSTSYEAATETGIIAASRDPVALDAWAATRVLIPAAEKLGFGRTGSMAPGNSAPGSFGAWLDLSAQELRRAGYPVTMNINSVNVRVSQR